MWVDFQNEYSCPSLHTICFTVNSICCKDSSTVGDENQMLLSDLSVKKNTYLSFLVWHGVFLLSQDACPKNASYYGNRAATLMMLSRFREALEDSQQAVRLDDCFMKVSLNRLLHVEHHGHFQLCTPQSVSKPQFHLQNREWYVKILHSPKQEVCPSCPTGSSARGQVPPIVGKCHGGQSLLSEGFGAGTQQQRSPAGGGDRLNLPHCILAAESCRLSL